MTSSDEETWRVFCAIELPPSVRATILEYIAKLKLTVPEARASWARETNLHLTLKFLGEIKHSSVASLSKAAARATADVAPFTLQLEHTGVFPNQRQPRVLWIGVNDPSGELNRLYRQLEEQTAKEGFEREGRAFHPHLTVARLRQPKDARKLATAHQQLDFGPIEILVSELLVIRSELSSAGSKYTSDLKTRVEIMSLCKMGDLEILCASPVFSVSLWLMFLARSHHGDTEDPEVAQRNVRRSGD